MNLATNAYHAMEKNGGKMAIGLSVGDHTGLRQKFPDLVPGKYACLTVTDTGTGVPEQHISDFFDSFFTTKQ